MKKPPETFTMRLTPQLRAALDKAAREDQRSSSSMASIILSGWLTERGYLVAPRKVGRK